MAGLVQATWSIVTEETGAEEWRALRRIEGRVGVNSKGLDFSPLHEATKPNGTRCEKIIPSRSTYRSCLYLNRE